MKKSFYLAFVALLLIACNKAEAPKSDRPGIKNMAPAPISDIVLHDFDVEPNNSFLQASEISFTTDEMTISGSLDVGDIDSFKIKAKAGTVADIYVTPLDFGDILLDVSTNPKESDRIYYDNFGSKEEEILSNLRLTPQGLYVTVRARASEKIGYTLRIRRMVAEIAMEEEPNNSPSTAQLMTLPSSLQGTNNPTGDVDFFNLSINKSAVLRVETPKTPLEIIIQDGTNVIWSTTSLGEGIITSPQLEAMNRNYLLRITSLDVFEEIESYKLFLEEALLQTAEIEPNDSIDTAQNLTISTEPIQLSFSSASDVDYFMIGNRVEDEPQLLSARLLLPPNVEAQIEAFEATNRSPLPNARANTSLCAIPTQQNSPIILKVTHRSYPTLTYPINYALEVKTMPKSLHEIEPNDLPENALDLPLDTPIKANIFPENDVDIYRITLPESPQVEGVIGQLQISSSPEYIAGLRFRLQDSQFFEISQAQSQVFSQALKINFDAPNGVYYLIVTGSGDACAKEYEITAKFTPKPSNVESEALNLLDNLPQTEAKPAPIIVPIEEKDSLKVDDTDSF